MTNTSLILEGGTFRTIYSGGVLDAFLDHHIHLPYILAISAGAINACSYVSKQKERTLRVFTNYRHDKRYMGLRNFLKERSLFGLDFAYNVIPNELDLFDWDTYQKFEGQIEIGVTNANTGQIEFLDALQMDKECMMLRATCAIPVLFPEIKLNDTPYYDGGLADAIPPKSIKDFLDLQSYNENLFYIYSMLLSSISNKLFPFLNQKCQLLNESTYQRLVVGNVIKVSSYYRYKNKKSLPSYKTLEKILLSINSNIDEFLAYIDTRYNQFTNLMVKEVLNFRKLFTEHNNKFMFSTKISCGLCGKYYIGYKEGNNKKYRCISTHKKFVYCNNIKVKEDTLISLLINTDNVVSITIKENNIIVMEEDKSGEISKYIKNYRSEGK